ncbi:MAG: hypothetical protein ACFE8N_14740 [Promethearchaeota archaeon]
MANYKIMTIEHISNEEMGLPVGSKAPIIKTVDVFENNFDLSTITKKYRGIVLDFSRGAW